jgi:class 3 adenylate cyclase
VGDAEAVLDEVQEFLTAFGQRRSSIECWATVLFTDIVGSTERANELGDRAWRELLQMHHALIRQEPSQISWS